MSAYKVTNKQIDKILDPITDCLTLSPMGRIFSKEYLRYRIDMFGLNSTDFDKLEDLDILKDRSSLKQHVKEILSYVGSKLLVANEYALFCRYDDTISPNDYEFSPGIYETVENTPDQKISNLLQAIKEIDCLLYQLSEGDTLKRFENVLDFLNYLKGEYSSYIIQRTTSLYSNDDTI